MRILHLTLLFLVPIFSLKAETLEEAWQLALANNPKMNAVQASTQASEQQLKATENQQLPTLTVNGGYTQYSDPIVGNVHVLRTSLLTIQVYLFEPLNTLLNYCWTTLYTLH